MRLSWLRCRHQSPVILTLCLAALLASAGLVSAQVGAEARDSQGPLSLPGVQEPDTLRTNVWLTEALMSEIVTATSQALPPPPATIELIQSRVLPEERLFKSAALRVLSGMGYQLFESDTEAGVIPDVDCTYSFQVTDVDLEYPEIGRTLGIWRRWVDRSLSVTAQIDIKMADSGRLLLSDRVTRVFSDRVAAGNFDDVDSQLYSFTTAETQESGWKGRIEEIVVLGTLAGLVAVYFSNTGD